MGVVLGFNPDFAPINFAFGNRDTGHRHDALRRPEQAGQTGERIHPQIEERTAAGLVKPFAPGGPCPAVTSAGGARLADFAAPDAARERLKGRAEHGERRTDQVAGAAPGQLDQGRSFLEGRGHRFLDQHMLARFEGGPGEPGVVRHRSENDHKVDR